MNNKSSTTISIFDANKNTSNMRWTGHELNKNKNLAPLCQACVFDFGNEFCRRDPEPGQRKIMMVNITCVQENIVKDQEKVN